MISGVYYIRNLLNRKTYIGSAINIKKRFITHKVNLNNNTHDNKHLQAAWNKYKGKNFEFTILLKCPKEYNLKLEQWFIDNLKPEYNIRVIATSNLGLKYPNRRGNRKGEKRSKEHCEALRGNKRGAKNGKPIEVFNLDGTKFNEFKSSTECARILKISVASISLVLNSKRFSAHGYIFKKKT